MMNSPQQSSSSSCAPEAEDTTFYQVLRSDFAQYYKSITNEQKIICIPPDYAVRIALRLNSNNNNNSNNNASNFIKAHILKESPYFLGQYVSDQGQEFFMEEDNNGDFLVAKKDAKIRIQVTHKERFYNSNYQPYHVWFIDQCIEINTALEEKSKRASLFSFFSKKSKSEQQITAATTATTHNNSTHPNNNNNNRNTAPGAGSRNNNNSNSSSVMPTPENYLQCVEYLTKVHRPTLDHCKALVNQFNKSIVLVPGFEEKIVQKIDDIFDEVVQIYLTNNSKLFKDSKQYFSLQIAVHSYIMDGVHDKVMSHWRSISAEADAHLYSICKALGDLSMDDLGVPPHFRSEQKSAVSRLSELPTKHTVYEKLMVVKQTSDEILKNISRAKHPNKKSDDFLTTDDLIPILAYVIINASCPTLCAEVRYMHTFMQAIPELETSELGFNLVSLEAAVELVKAESEKYRDKIVPSTPPTPVDSMMMMMMGSNSRNAGKSPSKPRRTQSSIPTSALNAPSPLSSPNQSVVSLAPVSSNSSSNNNSSSSSSSRYHQLTGGDDEVFDPMAYFEQQRKTKQEIKRNRSKTQAQEEDRIPDIINLKRNKDEDIGDFLLSLASRDDDE